MLRNEVGWFEEEENSADTLSMRLANDATFVRAAFSNRLSIFIQDSAAVTVAILIGMLLQWRLALVALATLPVLAISAVAQAFHSQFQDKKAIQSALSSSFGHLCASSVTVIHNSLDFRPMRFKIVDVHWFCGCGDTGVNRLIDQDTSLYGSRFW